MKKFLLGILFTLISIVGTSQLVQQQNWKVENEGEWGSFYWSVARTQYPDLHGKYFYYVYFYSNSYFNTKSDNVNYDRASTYINKINITMHEYRVGAYGNFEHYNKVSVYVPGFTCEWYHDERYYVAYFWSYSASNRFKITYGDVSPYYYSVY